jgi:phage/plasmid-associated DNA primase
MTQEKVMDLMKFLGEDCVLLPIPTGEKRPMDAGWQKTTPAAARKPEHLRRLEAGNIGVLLGKAGGGLCSIDIDSDESAEEFAKLNPTLTKTLQTKGARGRNFWVRIEGEFPPLAKITDWGEWRSDGGQTVIWGKHPTGGNYKWIVVEKPITIKFSDIVWPDHLDLPWKIKVDNVYNDLVEEFGKPWKEVRDKKEREFIVSLNQPFWAGKYQHDHRVLYEPQEQDFYEYEGERGIWRVKSEDAIKQEISRDILKFSREQNRPEIEHMRSDNSLAGIVRQLRGIVEHRDAFTLHRIPGVHCSNRFIKFEAGAIEEHEFSPDFFSRNQCPVEFRGLDLVPERFLNELAVPAIPDPDDLLLFQKYLGMCLFGRNIIQRFMVLYGQAGGGKSTLHNVVHLLSGKENMAQLRTQHLDKQFELYRYRAKTLLSGVDVPGNFLQMGGAKVIKGLTGGDVLDAEGKGINDGYHIVGNYNIIITANEKLRVSLEGDVEAWRRRLLLLEFNQPPPARKIDRFAEKLVEEEGPAILAWGLRGFLLLQKDVEETGDIRLPDSQAKRIHNLLAESESVDHFIHDRVDKVKGSDVTMEEFVQLYGLYCAEKGWRPLSGSRMSHLIRDKMLELRQSNISNSVRKSKKGFRNIHVQGQEEEGYADAGF